MPNDPTPAEARAPLIEQMRRLYRGLEMSAGIMRDRRRTGGWEGADRTADAFARYAAAAQGIHALIVAATPSTDARSRGQAEERERCARIAESVDLFSGDRLKNSDPRVTIAAAIRSGETPVGEGRV